MNKTVHAQRGGGFTLVELIVCIAIIVVLAALLFPAVRGTMEQSRAVKCVGHHKQVVGGILMYAGENEGKLPPYGSFSPEGAVDGGRYWWNLVRSYLSMPDDPALGIGYNYLRCPSAGKTVTTTIGVHYAERANLAPFGFEGGSFPGSMRLNRLSPQTVLTADIENPAGQLWFLSPNEYPLNTDSDKDGIKDSYPGNSFSARHNGNAVCGFADGSARIVPLSEWGRNEGKMWGPWSRIPTP